MASIPLGTSSWLPPVAVAVAAASRIPRQVHVHPLAQRRPSSAARVKMQAPLRTRDVFRSHCDKHLREPAESDEPADNHDPNNAASSKNVPLVEELREYLAENGVRVPPDMFLKEKDRISNYRMKLSSSANSLNVGDKVVAELFCIRALSALDLASEVMEIASLGCGMIEICQHTVDQMVRTYATIFCKFAEDACHKKIEMETTLSFVGALRCLGSICRIMVEDTVAKLKDGPFRNSIICHMDKRSQQFVKTVKNLEDVIAETKSQLLQQEATRLLFYGVERAHSYIVQLNECREAAVAKLT